RLSELEGCDNFGINLAFTPDGSLLASSGWEQKVRFWSWRTGQQLVSAPGKSNLRFGQDRRMLYEQANKVQLVEFAVGREYQSLGPGPGGSDISRIGAIDPEGRLLAVGTRDGTVHFWDLNRAEELGQINGASSGGVYLEFAGRDGLVMTGTSGMVYFPIQEGAGAHAPVRFGPPQYWCAGKNEVASSADGQIVAISRFEEGAMVYFRDWRKPPVPLRPQANVRTVGISPDGRFVGTATFGGDGGIKVWEAASGRLVKEFPVGPQGRAVFSPDGKWLAAKGQDKGYILKLGSWEEQVPVQWNWETRAAFSPNSRLLAAPMEDGSINLIDPATGTEKARLEDPSQHTASWLGFTPDGTRLIVVSLANQAVHIWELRLIREELDALGLDWHEPPYPPAPVTQEVERLKVEIIGNELLSDPRKMLETELQSYAVRLFTNRWDAEAHFHCGRISLALGNAKGGLSELDIALRLEPDRFSALALRAEEHHKAGRWQQAADDYKHLLEVHPEEYFRYGHVLGDCYTYLMDCRAALDAYDRCVRAGGDDPALLDSLAWALVNGPKELRDPKRALPLILEAERRSPDVYEYLHTLGVTYYRLGRYQDALTTLERAGKLAGSTPPVAVVSIEAMCHYQLGDKRQAERLLEQLMATKDPPDLPEHILKERQGFRAEAELLIRPEP
ncbi:MAG TPA: tetratricopeptide repeat protein, partial [Gemmataceae bacterium]|nr:tetratricopeptide repeat protein [Gemmataceae bacterium]